MIRCFASALATVALWAATAGSAAGGEFQLLDGQVISGEPVSFNSEGVVIKRPDGTFGDRVAWTNLTVETLGELAKLAPAKRFVEPFLIEEEETPLAKEKSVADLKPKPVPRLARSDPKAGLGALFSSPLSITLLLILYLANLYAAFEISIFRNYPAILVCGAAALLPVLGPLVFLSLGTRVPTRGEDEADDYAADAYGETEAAAGEAAPAATPAHAAEHAPAAKTAPTVYQRGQFTFNRRFFETKLAGFLRLVPSEAEKDLVVLIRSGRNEYLGSRITRVMANELFLQVVSKAGVSSDVTIPFSDISEVQVRHKDFRS